MDVNGKKMVSFDVRALFTNVPVDGAMAAASRALTNASDEDLPVPKEDLLKLVSLCVSFNGFTFENNEYQQINGLAMGSPLSAVLACLYMETMEEDFYKNIVGENSTWVRYVDDVLCFIPEDADVSRLLQDLNNVEPVIQFTTEEEVNAQIPFLDTLILKDGGKLKFKVYRKPTSKNDMVHYFSAHSQRIKSGVVIGFFLRALRICSDDYLQEEIEFVIESFSKLRYPLAMLLSLKRKAQQIMSRPSRAISDQKQTPTVFVPSSKVAEQLQTELAPYLKIVTTGGKKIGQILKHKGSKKDENTNSAVYKVSCGKCSRIYYGETGRGLTTRVREHRADLRYRSLQE